MPGAAAKPSCLFHILYKDAVCKGWLTNFNKRPFRHFLQPFCRKPKKYVQFAAYCRAASAASSHRVCHPFQGGKISLCMGCTAALLVLRVGRAVIPSAAAGTHSGGNSTQNCVVPRSLSQFDAHSVVPAGGQGETVVFLCVKHHIHHGRAPGCGHLASPAHGRGCLFISERWAWATAFGLLLGGLLCEQVAVYSSREWHLARPASVPGPAVNRNWPEYAGAGSFRTPAHACATRKLGKQNACQRPGTVARAARRRRRARARWKNYK